MARHGIPVSLAQVEAKSELAKKYAKFLPAITRHEQRRIRGEQDIIVRYEPERALETLPQLLSQESDRDKLRTFLEQLLAEESIQQLKFTEQQSEMLDRIKKVLGPAAPAKPSTRKRFKAKSRGMQPA